MNFTLSIQKFVNKNSFRTTTGFHIWVPISNKLILFDQNKILKNKTTAKNKQPPKPSSCIVTLISTEIPLKENIFRKTLSWWRSLSDRNQSIDLLSNQWTGFYIIRTSVIKELMQLSFWKKFICLLFLKFRGCLLLLPTAENNTDDYLETISQFHLLFS